MLKLLQRSERHCFRPRLPIPVRNETGDARGDEFHVQCADGLAHPLPIPGDGALDMESLDQAPRRRSSSATGTVVRGKVDRTGSQ